MNANSILNVLYGWLYRDDTGVQKLKTNTDFAIVVRSSVDVKPGAVLLIDTLEVTDGVVIAIAYPRDPQVEEEVEDFWPDYSIVREAPKRKPKWRVYWGRFRHWLRGIGVSRYPQ